MFRGSHPNIQLYCILEHSKKGTLTAPSAPAPAVPTFVATPAVAAPAAVAALAPARLP